MQVGEHLFGLLTAFAGIRPQDRVLEIGCGVGRTAAPLTRFITPPGRYDGLDVSRPSIRWCRWAIGRRFRQFRFQHADIQNGEYNPAGRIPPERYVFPYASETFDLVFLTSVFTHMLPAAIPQYLAEIRRVLAPGGRLLATFFLVPLRPLPEGVFRIDHQRDGYWTADPARPEWAVAYEEAQVRRWFRDAGLAIREPIQRGYWSEPERTATFQDLIVAFRE